MCQCDTVLIGVGQCDTVITSECVHRYICGAIVGTVSNEVSIKCDMLKRTGVYPVASTKQLQVYPVVVGSLVHCRDFNVTSNM